MLALLAALTLALLGTRAPAPAGAQQINSTVALGIVIQQQEAEVPLIEAQALQLWANATAEMALVAEGLQLAAANVSTLYGAGDGAALMAMVNASECGVASAQSYAVNATAFYVYACCVVRKLRTPALLKVATEAYRVYHGAGVDADADSTGDTLQNIADVQFVDRMGFARAPCLDDASIFQPQEAGARAIGALTITSCLMEATRALYLYATSVAGCLSAPTSVTGCNTNATLTLAAVAPNMRYAEFDPVYAAVCGAPALGAFYAAQTAATCKAVAPP